MSEPLYNIDYDALAAAVAAMPKPIDKTAWVDEFFRDRLAATLPGYEPRAEQIRMARMIARGLTEGRHVIAEAGTGTGKSLAYLVPVIRHCLEEHCRAIVSTGTIALQEQLINKDLPMLTGLFPELKYTLAKGKSNYVCPLRLRDEVEKHAQELTYAEYHRPLFDWARETTTGDRSDYAGDPGPDWAKICVDDSCPGLSKCPCSGDCFYARARAKWDEADIIVTNHALLCLHLRLQAESAGAAGILPEARVVVLDEAHHLKDQAREAWAIQISSLRLPLLLAQAVKVVPEIPAEDDRRAREFNERFFAALRDIVSTRGDATLHGIPPGGLIATLADDLATAARTVERALADTEDERAEALAEQFAKFRAELASVVAGGPDEQAVTWVEVNAYRRDSERITLHRTPIDVAPILRDALWDAYDSVICTSATLAAGGGFGYFRQATGCPSDALELIVDSPFDYYNQCLLYIPNDLPEPRDNPLYYQQIAPRIQEILERTDGRAFVLFTSYRGMNETYDLLSPRLRWQVLKQGDLSKQELIRRFKKEHSVLFATSSFWEGVDIPGAALSAVIICTLPFSPPNDPITQAKMNVVKKRGGNDFREIMLPEMILRLKQGFGRLIRTKQDCGLVAILDTRIWTKHYGGEILRSLPHCKQITDLKNLELFFNMNRSYHNA